MKHDHKSLEYEGDNPGNLKKWKYCPSCGERIEVMTKDEMAEWLAVDVLGWKLNEEGKFWDRRANWSDRLEIVWAIALTKVIYSPSGLEAVWEAIMEKFPLLEISYSFSFTERKAVCCGFTNHDDGDADWSFNQFGDDRYEAFYKAVYEAMKG